MAMRLAAQSQGIAKQADKRAERVVRDESFSRLGDIIRNTITAKNNSTFEIAVDIRNRIYQQVPLKETPNDFLYMNFVDAYINSMRDNSVGHWCEGYAKIYAIALESQGIPARYVGIFSKDKEPFDSHATIEFWFKGKWYASDPTFNVMFKNKGEFISYSQLYALVNKSDQYEIVTNGYPILPSKDIEKYYTKLDELMSYMVVHPSQIWSEGERLDFPMELSPKTWDGSITFDNGKKRDVTNFRNIYKYLNKGPLR